MLDALRARAPRHLPDGLLRELLVLSDPRVLRLRPRAPRVLLAGGEAATGERLVGALAGVRGLPLVRIPAGAVAEYGWRGLEVDTVVAAMARAARAAGRVDHGILLLDGFDQATRRARVDHQPWRGDAADPEDPFGDGVRQRRQLVLADLLRGTVPPPDPSLLADVAGTVPDPDRWLVVASAPRVDVEERRGVTAEVLERWGVVPDLVACFGVRLRVPSRPAGGSPEQRFADALVEATVLARSLGYALHVARTVLGRLEQVVDGGTVGETDAGRALVDAVRRRVAFLLCRDDGAHDDGDLPALLLTPDDLSGLGG